MSLVLADDFSGPLSIGGTIPKTTYYDHKPPHGWQDFSPHPSPSRAEPNNPFAQVDTYLRIRASDKLHSSGLISSVKNDGSGVKVDAALLLRVPLHRPQCHRHVAGASGSSPTT